MRGRWGHSLSWQALQGMTLIEVLVSLTVLAVALMAGMQAASGMTYLAQRQWQVMLAQICVDNALYQQRLVSVSPSVGHQTHVCEQAGLNFLLDVTVAPTPNPSIRRMDVVVSENQERVLRLTTVWGRD